MSSFWRWTVESWRRLIQWIIRLVERLFPSSGGGGTIPDDKCCFLARKDNECKWVGSKSSFTCPQGFYRQWWYCCEGTHQLACAECTTSQSNCWSGSFDCSIWWDTGQSC